jgi:hypothetical protein
MLWADAFKKETLGKFSVIADGAIYLNGYNERHKKNTI